MPSTSPSPCESGSYAYEFMGVEAFGLEVEAEEESDEESNSSHTSSDGSDQQDTMGPGLTSLGLISGESLLDEDDVFKMDSRPGDKGGLGRGILGEGSSLYFPSISSSLSPPLPPSPTESVLHERRHEMLNLSIGKLRSMSQERGVELSLRKSVLIFNTMRCLQVDLCSEESSESEPSSNTSFYDDQHQSDEPYEPQDQDHMISAGDEPDYPFSLRYSRQLSVANGDGSFEREKAEEDRTEWSYPSQHIYPSAVEEGLLLCGEKGNANLWSFNDSTDSGYGNRSTTTTNTEYSLLLDETTTEVVEVEVDEAMDTSESPPPSLVALPPSVFSTTRSELTKTFHILNPDKSFASTNNTAKFLGSGFSSQPTGFASSGQTHHHFIPQANHTVL